MRKGPERCFGRVCAPRIGRLLCLALFLPALSGFAQGVQNSTSLQLAPRALSAALPEAPAPQRDDPDAVTIRNTPKHILKDQEAIWTSPVHIHRNNLVWLLPLAAATGVSLATDSHTMRTVVSHDPSFNHDNLTASNVMMGTLLAVPAVEFGYGALAGNGHEREAGILGAESAVDAAIVEQGMKLIFWRERPAVDNANGRFWQSSVGLDSSFPSSHTVFAWSMAAVIAGEHPAPLSQFTVYSLATGVSLTRVLGQEHFPTDVLVGSAAGWLVGHYVYKVRHRWHRHND